MRRAKRWLAEQRTGDRQATKLSSRQLLVAAAQHRVEPERQLVGETSAQRLRHIAQVFDLRAALVDAGPHLVDPVAGFVGEEVGEFGAGRVVAKRRRVAVGASEDDRGGHGRTSS